MSQLWYISLYRLMALEGNTDSWAFSSMVSALE